MTLLQQKLRCGTQKKNPLFFMIKSHSGCSLVSFYSLTAPFFPPNCSIYSCLSFNSHYWYEFYCSFFFSFGFSFFLFPNTRTPRRLCPAPRSSFAPVNVIPGYKIHPFWGQVRTLRLKLCANSYLEDASNITWVQSVNVDTDPSKGLLRMLCNGLYVLGIPLERWQIHLPILREAATVNDPRTCPGFALYVGR